MAIRKGRVSSSTPASVNLGSILDCNQDAGWTEFPLANVSISRPVEGSRLITKGGLP